MTYNKMLPSEYYRFALSFFRFIRRVSILTENDIQLRGLYLSMVLLTNRFRMVMIINLDETPLPFHLGSDSSYNFKGEKTITTRVEKSGWDKRQATVLLIINADGSWLLNPLVIFKGEKDRDLLKKESDLYDPDVLMEFNEKA